MNFQRVLVDQIWDLSMPRFPAFQRQKETSCIKYWNRKGMIAGGHQGCLRHPFIRHCWKLVRGRLQLSFWILATISFLLHPPHVRQPSLLVLPSWVEFGVVVTPLRLTYFAAHFPYKPIEELFLLLWRRCDTILITSALRHLRHCFPLSASRHRLTSRRLRPRLKQLTQKPAAEVAHM
jgi:hypothetical protein